VDFLPFHSLTRTSISCKVTFVAWRFGVLEIGRDKPPKLQTVVTLGDLKFGSGFDFVVEQRSLSCAVEKLRLCLSVNETFGIIIGV
jgi:hypothetical protein